MIKKSSYDIEIRNGKPIITASELYIKKQRIHEQACHFLIDRKMPTVPTPTLHSRHLIAGLHCHQKII
jgi:hypothetical protein